MLSGSVSRVLSFKAIICLRLTLPQGFSHPSEYRRADAGEYLLLLSVLLRIGFAGPCGSPHAGELLPRLSTLTCTRQAVYLCCTFPKVTLGGR